MATPKDRNGVEETEDLYSLVDNNWSSEVSSLATATMAEARFNVSKSLPVPGDLKQLSDHLQMKAHFLSNADKLKSREVFREGVEVAQARLLTYNKRRPGEIEAIRYC